jgi:hypothetical protein
MNNNITKCLYAYNTIVPYVAVYNLIVAMQDEIMYTL